METGEKVLMGYTVFTGMQKLSRIVLINEGIMLKTDSAQVFFGLVLKSKQLVE